MVTNGCNSSNVHYSQPVLVMVATQVTQDDPSGASVCYGTSTTIDLDNAIGGNENNTYLWQQSADGTNWGNASGTNNTPNYTTPNLNSDMYYRRRVTNGCNPSDIQFTQSALITVESQVTQTNPTATTVCYGTSTTINLSAANGGDADNSYLWQESANNSSWGPATGINNTQDYTTPNLTSNMYYRRRAINGCNPSNTHESQAALVTVQPPVSQGNPLGVSICDGSSTTINLAVATGGDANNSYLWQESATGDEPWSVAQGINNTQNYTTPNLNSNMYYRRMVANGCNPDNVHYSNPALITINTALEITDLSSEQTICYNSRPSALHIEVTLAPRLTYQWEQSLDNLNWINASGGSGSMTATYTPPILTGKTYYRCKASSDCGNKTSDAIPINVLEEIKVIAISKDTNICYNTLSNPIKVEATGGQNLTYNWEQRTFSDTTWVLIEVGVGSGENTPVTPRRYF